MTALFNRIPPLHLLAAFEAAARYGSFAKAAEELSVTPSAVSHRIKNLEELWGGELFVRGNSTLRLTSSGTVYLRGVQQALGALNSLARPEFNAQRSKLRVAIPPTFGRQHLVHRLGDFTALYPHIDLELHIAVPFLDVVAEGVDVEVRFGTGVYGNFKTTLLLDEPVFPACGRDYYDRINGASITKPEELRNLTLLRSPLEPWKPWFAQAELAWPEPTEGTQFNDIGCLLEAVAANQGVALVRQRMAQRWLATGQIVRLLDLESQSPHAYYIVEKAQGNSRVEMKMFVDWLLNTTW